MLKFWREAAKGVPDDKLAKIGMYEPMGIDQRWWEADHMAQQNLSSTSKDMYQ